MSTKLFDRVVIDNTDAAVDFISSILQTSTEYSIIGKSLQGTILLWNEGARRLYGYEGYEVVGKMNAALLNSPEDNSAHLHAERLELALRVGKWEGTVVRQRKDGTRFIAHVVIAPRRDSHGVPIGHLMMSKDISAEVRLTDELRNSRNYARALIESNIDALVTTDSIGIIGDLNQQMEALTGYSRTQLIGSAFADLFTDPRGAEEAIRLVLRDGHITNYGLTVIASDGRMTVLSYSASTIRGPDGKLLGVFAAGRAITERHVLEQQLSDAASHGPGLADDSVYGLITVDCAGMISDVNESFCRRSGYSRQELIDSEFSERFTDAERAGRGVEEVFANGSIRDFGLGLVSRNGRTNQVAINATVFSDPSGPFGACVSAFAPFPSRRAREFPCLS